MQNAAPASDIYIPRIPSTRARFSQWPGCVNRMTDDIQCKARAQIYMLPLAPAGSSRFVRRKFCEARGWLLEWRANDFNERKTLWFQEDVVMMMVVAVVAGQKEGWEGLVGREDRIVNGYGIL